MNWLTKLERRFGRYTIPNLISILVGGQIVVYAVELFVNRYITYYLSLTRSALFDGELWRLVTFLFVPSGSGSILNFALSAYFLWFIGSALEGAWGSFRFDLYVLAGAAGAVLACLLTGAGGNYYLILSLTLAFAMLYPDMQVLLFFFIPIKIKWLGWAAAAMWLLEFITSRMTLRVSLLFGLAGFLVFFGPELFGWCKERVVSYKRRKDWENRWKQ